MERLDEMAKNNAQQAIYNVLVSLRNTRQWKCRNKPANLQPLILKKCKNWVASYHDLFTATCQKCQKRLLFNSPHFKYIPPTLRILKPSSDDKAVEWLAYHNKCI